MLGDLLRELSTAFGVHITRNARRILHWQQPPKSDNAQRRMVVIEPTSVGNPKITATRASIEALSDKVGLASAYLEPVSWPPYAEKALPPDLLTNPVFKIWSTFPDSHKWTHYFGIYSTVFESRRHEPLRVLEIGVFMGASLKLWKNYFTHPDTLIVGIDILPQCAQYDVPDSGIRVRIGSQTDPAFLREVVREFGPFDIIIDDGSHFSSHIIETFNLLFFEALHESGIYLVEDLHANYWHPWRDSRRSFFDICKELVELMHAHYRNGSPLMFLGTAPAEQLPLNVPLITTMIKEIRFFDSIVAIYKARLTHIPNHIAANLEPPTTQTPRPVSLARKDT